MSLSYCKNTYILPIDYEFSKEFVFIQNQIVDFIELFKNVHSGCIFFSSSYVYDFMLLKKLFSSTCSF